MALCPKHTINIFQWTLEHQELATGVQLAIPQPIPSFAKRLTAEAVGLKESSDLANLLDSALFLGIN